MRRNWLTSTTALALVLNAAAPIPGAATGVATVPARDETPQLTRLAQTDTEAETATEALEEALEDAGAQAEAEAEAAQQAIEAAAAEGEAAQQEAETQAEAEAEAAQQAADAAAAEEEAAAAAAQQAAEAEAAAEADAQAVEADAADQQAAEAEATAAAEAEAAAAEQSEADAAQQAEENAAAQAEADAAAANAAQQAEDEAAQAEADAAASAAQEAEEDAAAQADADAAADAAQQDADDAAAADAAQQAEEDAAADAAAAGATQQEAEGTATTDAAEQEAAQEATEPVDAEAEPDTQAAEDAATAEPADQEAEADADAAAQNEAGQPATDTAEVPEVTAEEQAEALAEEAEEAPAAAAATGEGEVVDTQEATVTEEDARASNEEFATTAAGQQTAAPAAKKKDNDLLKGIGIAAAAGLGVYAIGKMLDNGGQVVSNTGDRAVVRDPNGQYRIIKDDDTLLRQPGSNVATQTYSDGSTRTEVVAADNSSTVTVRAADGRVLRRTRILPNGQEVLLFDDTRSFDRVDVSNLRPATQRDYDYSSGDAESLRAALSAKNEALPDRSFSLNQIRRIDAVRKLVPVIALDAINFRTGSAVIDAQEAQDLSDLGKAMRRAIEDDPAQVFLIEGHTDTVGDASYNLALSDRRAESVALALTEYFDVPPSNMIVQGYGEADLRIKQTGDVRANRRAAVRNITPLLNGRN